MLAEDLDDSPCLNVVTCGRPRAVRVDVGDLVRPHVGISQCVEHRSGSASALRIRQSHVRGIAGGAVADNLTQNGGMARLGALERFQNQDASSSEVIEAFLKQYYHQAHFIPNRILISEPVEDIPAISAWLSDLAGRSVLIRHPRRGDKKHLLELSITNAQDLLSRNSGQETYDLLQRAKTLLQIQNVPRRVEGLDISNIQGNNAVGALVSFVDGLPHKSGYRSYRIAGVEGIDDYRMMAEMVQRRLQRGNPPDLFLVDGGRGHLQAVKRVVDQAGMPDGIDVVSIAKERESGGGEKVYIPGRKNPVALRENEPVLLFLMRIRDEAHRRAVLYHRKLRGRDLTASDLDQIPGMGPERKKALLRHFGDIHAIAGARMEDLEKVQGMGPVLAREIVEFFSGTEEYELTESKDM